MIAAITPKVGRQRRADLRHAAPQHHRAANGLMAVEEQDIVYLEAKRNAPEPKAEKPAPRAAQPPGAMPSTPDPVMLFRYSALHFNGHRIHYDADYARDVEGYPALVVNGGVTTLFLLEAALRRAARRAGAADRVAHHEAAVLRARRLRCAARRPMRRATASCGPRTTTGAMALRIEARIG